MARYRYQVVDVFTDRPLEGNPLAVFPDAANIDPALLPKIAQELNLSETVFLYPPTRSDCAAKLRIFTPARELPFAGHPTVGAAFVLLQENAIAAGTNSFVLEENIGAVPIRVDPGERPLIWLRTPPLHWGATFDPTRCAAALGLESSDLLPCPPQLVSAGNPGIFIPLCDPAAVDRASLDLHAFHGLADSFSQAACVFVFAPTAEGAYSRMFAPELGVVEDPATGSATGPLAAYMLRHNLAPNRTRFLSEQGTKMGRRSILHIQIAETGNEQHIDIGGRVTPLIEATMIL